jgi:hypothetical protein
VDTKLPTTIFDTHMAGTITSFDQMTINHNNIQNNQNTVSAFAATKSPSSLASAVTVPVVLPVKVELPKSYYAGLKPVNLMEDIQPLINMNNNVNSNVNSDKNNGINSGNLSIDKIPNSVHNIADDRTNKSPKITNSPLTSTFRSYTNLSGDILKGNIHCDITVVNN